MGESSINDVTFKGEERHHEFVTMCVPLTRMTALGSWRPEINLNWVWYAISAVSKDIIP